ncbi:uncharacterized protein METZ01_LOCUS219540, partial [marine metagenome]
SKNIFSYFANVLFIKENIEMIIKDNKIVFIS